MYLSPVVEQNEEESYHTYNNVGSPDPDGLIKGKSGRVFKFPTAGSFTVKLKRQARHSEYSN